MMPSPPFGSNGQPSDPPVLVGLGGSAGSIDALKEFFDGLPESSGAAFAVVIHLPPDRESRLHEILASHTSMPVTRVEDAVEIETDHVYVAPSDRGLVVEDQTLAPVEFERSDGVKAPIDQFFRSLAQYGAASVGVVLSGASSDGTVGLRAIEEAGGLVAAQDPNEAEYDLMPRSAIQMSRVDLVLPVADLADRVSAHSEMLSRLADVHEIEDPETNGESPALLQDIFDQVRNRTGHDFSEYKQSTMRRRIQRRMQVNQIPSLEAYRDFLRDHPEEVQSLQQDLLISVTNFFRDPESFRALQEQVIPTLFEGKSADDEIRAWVVGTATGEEAYSLAILLLEHARSRTPVPETIQIFATDIDEAALGYAREGHYPEPIAADVPEEYLKRYFTKEGAQYVVKEHVRDHVLFTPHNLLEDPPFSKLDLISCRNLLIYLRRDLQKSVFNLFSYALKENGYLFLGGSESAKQAGDDFQTVDKSHRIYRLRAQSRTVPNLPSMPLSPTPSRYKTSLDHPEPSPSEATVHQRLIADYGPPSVVVNEEHRLLHLSDDAGRYLEHPSGTPRTNAVELLRPALQAKARSVLQEAFEERQPAHSPPTEVALNGTNEVVRLVAHPGSEADQTENAVLLVFEPVEDSRSLSALDDATEDRDRSSVEERLRAELKQTREELRSTVEEYESSQQKLQAANEELRSMNEEYKSMTEELETSKEELQSVNEELKTVNQELEEKVEKLRQANSDLKNVMSSTRIGTLFLDRELHIQRFTPRIEDLFNIRPADKDRPIGDLTHDLDYDSLVADAESVLDDLQPIEREIQTDDGQWFLVRLRPYRTIEDRIEGVVLAFIDITDRREAEEALRRSEEFHRLAVEAARVGTWDLDLDSGDYYISPMMGELLGYSSDQFAVSEDHWQQRVPRERWLETVHPADRSALEDAIATAAEHEESFALEFRVRPADDDAVRWLFSKGTVTRTEEGGLHLRGATIDITERREAKLRLESAIERLQARTEQVESLSDALTTAEEKVRSRISRILHDEVQQSLFAATLKLENMEERSALEADQRGAIARAKELVRDTIETTRTLSKDLNPPIEDKSLREALAWLSDQIEEAHGLSVSTWARGSSGPVDESIRTLLFHTVRELLFNVVKHAGVDEAVLLLAEGDNRIRVVVEDDGSGFDPATLEDSQGGTGLADLKHRIDLMGGDVDVDSAPGEGTRVTLELPRETAKTDPNLAL